MAEKIQPRKPQHRTDSPYTQPKLYDRAWSGASTQTLLTPPSEKIPQPHHDTLVKLLTNLLAPLSDQTAKPRSKGRRNKKRKRKATENVTHDAEASAVTNIISKRPPVASHVLIGFNGVNRHLEALSSISGKSLGLPLARPDAGLEREQNPRHVAAVFLCRAPEDVLYGHLPTLCFTASLAHPELLATRLIVLDSAVESKIAGILGHARMSMLAITEAETESDVPGMTALLEYVRDDVDAMSAGWLTEAGAAKWLGTKVDIS